MYRSQLSLRNNQSNLIGLVDNDVKDKKKQKKLVLYP
jgi:hypothetical protein